MPKDFTDCVSSGGKVVTKKLKGNRYLHICYDKEGNSFAGEVMTKKKSKASNDTEKQIKKSRALAQDLLRLKKHFDENYRIDKVAT